MMTIDRFRTRLDVEIEFSEGPFALHVATPDTFFALAAVNDNGREMVPLGTVSGAMAETAKRDLARRAATHWPERYVANDNARDRNPDVRGSVVVYLVRTRKEPIA